MSNKLFNKFKFIVTILCLCLFGVSVFAKSKKQIDALESLKKNAKSESDQNVNALQAEMLIASQEEKAIKQVNKLIKKYKGTQLESGLLMRLAELHLRRAKTDRFLEIHKSSEEIVSVAPKLVKNAASKKQIEKAIDLLSQIEKRFPHYDNLDSVIFNNAFANQQIGNHKKAEALYSKLVDQFSESTLLPDAHLALGEIQFKNQKFKKALTHFESIKKFPDSVVYPYGVYKSAWTYYNLRETDKGLIELENVVKYGVFVQEQGIDSRLDIRKEALMDMALFYGDVKPSHEAYRYFERQSGELDMSPALLRLSELYKRHSRHNDIKIVLTEYIKKKSTSAYVPNAYVELMDASDKLKKRKDVVTLLNNFYNVCKLDSRWVKSQDNIASVEKCSSLFNQMSLGYANKWLKQWEKDKVQDELADSTEKAFVIHLQSNSKTDGTARARYVYAELLFKRKKYREASEQYALVGQTEIQDKMRHDARYFAIASLEKAVKDKWNDKDEKHFRKLAHDYLTKNKEGQYELDIRFKIALIAYENGRYDEAAPLFLELGQKFSDKEKGLRSQDLYLDTLNLKKDYKSLRDYSKQLLVNAKDNRADKLKKIYEESYFLIVGQLEDKGQYADAIKQYESFANENPQSQLSQKAMWNVMLLQYKAGNQMDGANASVAYYKKYGNTKDGLDALVKAAQTYESLGQLKLAADVLVQLASADIDNKTKWQLLAADFYILSSQVNRAKPIYLEIKSKSSKDNSFKALEQLLFIAKQENNKVEEVSLLKAIMASGVQPLASIAGLHFVIDAYAQKNYTEAFNQAKKIIAQANSGASRTALAEARLIQARILNEEFLMQSVKAKLERISMVLTLKTEKLSKAQIAFQSAANYGDPLVAVQAYKELADSYLHYSEALRQMPLPAGVPEAEATVFRSEMDKLSIPMEEKGIDAKLQAFKIAQDNSVQGPIVTDLQNELKKLNQQVIKDIGVVSLKPAALVLPKSEGVGT